MDTIKSRILVRRDTTENWNENKSFVPMRGEVIVYTDYGTIEDKDGNMVYVPWVKIGDGSAYLIDLPFVGEDARSDILQELRLHTGDEVAHVTQQERTFWNNKLNCEVREGTLVLNRA